MSLYYNAVGTINLKYIFLIHLFLQLSDMTNAASILQDYNAECVDRNRIPMINNCLLNSNIEVKKKLCSSRNEHILLNVPVTSKKTGFFYRNLECLKCNEENASDAMPWNLEIYCRSARNVSHLNYLSSNAEILKKTQNMQCGIAYQDANGWLWKLHDGKMLKACLAVQESSVTGEFKNFYCYSCKNDTYIPFIITPYSGFEFQPRPRPTLEMLFYVANLQESIKLNKKDGICQPNQTLSIAEVNRTGLEEQLLLLTRHKVSVRYLGNLYQFSLKHNANAFLLPSMVLNSELNNSCYIRREVFNDFEKYSHVTELLLCKQVELRSNEFWIDNETLELNIILKEVKLSNLEYTITPTNKVQVCAEQYKSMFSFTQEKESLFQYALGVALMISTCISLFCLIVTFLTYLLFPSLRTLPGQNNMCLIVSMISAHSLYQFGLLQTELVYACIVIGFLIHYFWLVTFLWLNVCSFHMFRVFRSMTSMISFRDNDRKTRTWLCYSIYSYGTPFFIVSINAGVTAIVRNYSDVGYGGVICFIKNPISLIVTFILPILLVCLSNIVFFVVTACRIRTSAKDSKERLMGSNKLHYSIYIKLFMITGISWIFQIIDSFLPDSVEKNVFSAITSLSNSLQGVFIFVAYVCKQRVLHLLKNKVCTTKKHLTTSKSSARTTRM